MISLKQKVKASLEGVCLEVICGYPRGFTGGKLVSWRESANRCHAQADGREHLAELNYTLEIFSDTPEGAYGLMAAADGRMLDAGFRREAAQEQLERDLGVSHITARYRALADGEGNIYQ